MASGRTCCLFEEMMMERDKRHEAGAGAGEVVLSPFTDTWGAAF